MSDQPSDEDRKAWHRRFAVEGNNRSWALVERATLTDAEREELLHTAYASMHHWALVGEARNHALSALLLAFVHAKLDQPSLAQGYAAKTSAYYAANPCESWERAFVEAALAASAAAAGDRDAHASHHAKALEIANTLDGEDRNIFMATFSRLPLP